MQLDLYQNPRLGLVLRVTIGNVAAHYPVADANHAEELQQQILEMNQ